jgi:hypothetical protein
MPVWSDIVLGETSNPLQILDRAQNMFNVLPVMCGEFEAQTLFCLRSHEPSSMKPLSLDSWP